MSLTSLQTIEPTQTSPTETFTLVFLDFDDTLIPSRLYRLFANNFSIDIFELFSTTKMRELQNIIIATIKKIRKHYENNEESIKFCVVSNAAQKWLDYMFSGSKSHFISSRVPILNQYFEQNGISVVSAPVLINEFLQKQFGDRKDEFLKESQQNKWIWKYTAFSSMISSFQNTTNKICKKIVSIGDGSDELKAVRHYTKTHKIESIHINLLRAPTINQLQKQWIYLHDNLLTLNIKQNYLFCLYDLAKIPELKSDNTREMMGKTYQLPAIQYYFQHWMNNLAGKVTADDKTMAIKTVCISIHKKMYSLDCGSVLSRNLKFILIKICKNEEFNAMFNSYFLQVKAKSINI